IFNEATRNHLYALDAPVSGGDIGAKNGTLSIMVGGEQHVFDTLLPLFNTLGENIILQGPAGAGQHTQMSNQITIASNMIGVSEAVIYAKQAGLAPNSGLDSSTTGGAGSCTVSNCAPRTLQEGSDA